ncbi:MAG TPA: hypothetical protein VMM12_08765, partial [Longimicrobiales bacterium]|nr:hypothetical protein [Longimicrobiales bacterium]
MMIESKDEERAGSPARDRGRRPETAGRRQVVLLIEDNETDRHLYGGLLWYNGFDVFHAEDGETGIERAVELRPD